jgi:predicted Rossmann-fold nucleotide-binding protein
MGTVTEVSLVWNKLMTGVIEPRPLVLLGKCWKPVVESWQENLVVSDEDVSLLDFAETADAACRIILAKSPKTI